MSIATIRCDSTYATHGERKYINNHFGCNFWTTGNPNLPVDIKSDLYKHLSCHESQWTSFLLMCLQGNEHGEHVASYK